MRPLFTSAVRSKVTSDEARQLNEAAEMLDANSIDLNATIEEDAR